MDIIKEGNFEPIGGELEPDDMKRVSLEAVMQVDEPGIRYKAFRNELGQILLLPVKSVLYHEAWVFENPERIASIGRGIKDIGAGRVVKLYLAVEEEG